MRMMAFRVLLTAPHRWLIGRPAGVTFKASITERRGEPAIARDPGFAQPCRVLATACLVLLFYSSEWGGGEKEMELDLLLG